MRNQQAVLVGNGPSQLIQENPCWAKLLKNVAAQIGVGAAGSEHDGTPYPLLYERLLLEARKKNGWTERKLKASIAKEVALVKADDLHSRIRALPVSDIMTTNYDHSLEQPSHASKEAANRGIIDERRYSLFRHRPIGAKQRLWYVHGDVRRPGSMLLGYEQYSGYLQQMRLYATSGIAYKHRTLGPVIRKGQVHAEGHSWLDLFFAADVWIIGLGLKFVEFHLWWLLTYRARQRALGVKLNNRVTYFCTSDADANAAKCAMLRELDVDVRVLGITGGDYQPHYLAALNEIGNAT